MYGRMTGKRVIEARKDSTNMVGGKKGMFGWIKGGEKSKKRKKKEKEEGKKEQ